MKKKSLKRNGYGIVLMLPVTVVTKPSREPAVARRVAGPSPAGGAVALRFGAVGLAAAQRAGMAHGSARSGA